MRSRQLHPPSRAILIHLPLTMIAELDEAAEALSIHRTDIIRRSLQRELQTTLSEEVRRQKARAVEFARPQSWSIWR